MNEKNSIKWIEDKIHGMIENGADFGDDLPVLLVHIQKAKEIHKEEIKNAYFYGSQDKGLIKRTQEQYYNETFNNNE